MIHEALAATSFTLLLGVLFGIFFVVLP